jgi:hypothetical protein
MSDDPPANALMPRAANRDKRTWEASSSGTPR